MKISAVSLLVSVLQLLLCLAASVAPSARPERFPQGCPDGWVGHSDVCYVATPTALTWNEAVKFCLQHNASLVTVEIGKKNRTVAVSMQAFSVYIKSELSSWKNESQLFWSDSDRMDKMEESEGCIAVKAFTGSWLIKHCDRIFPALCERDAIVLEPDASSTAANYSAATADFTSDPEPEREEEPVEQGLKLHPFVFVIIAVMPLIAVMIICGVVSNQLIMRKMRHRANMEVVYAPPIPSLDVHGFSSRELWSSTSLFDSPDQGSKLFHDGKKQTANVNKQERDYGDGLVYSSLPCEESKKETGAGTPLLQPSETQKSPGQFVPSVASRVFGSSASLASVGSHLFSLSKPPPS